MKIVFALSLLLSSHALAAEFRVGVVFDKGGKDDKSFNNAAYRGTESVKEKLKLSVKYVEAADSNAFEPLLRGFAQKKFDLIIGIGISQAEAMKKVATAFPDLKFAVVDADVSAPNVRTLLFEEHEGSYLVGALAAMASKSGTVGFIGGMEIPLIRRFEMGYVAGVKKVNPKAKVTTNYVGVTGEAWNNPAKAKELALSQIAAGADVIYGAAGGSGTGIFDAVEEKGKFAIGVDSNQNWIKPGQVLTSMLKRVDVAVAQTIEDAVAGKFTAGVKRYGLANGGIDYAVDEHNAKLISPEMKTQVEKLKAEIVAGKIQVPDFYKLKK
jgi:basic membrane protein A and related proteins